MMMMVVVLVVVVGMILDNLLAVKMYFRHRSGRCGRLVGLGSGGRILACPRRGRQRG